MQDKNTFFRKNTTLHIRGQLLSLEKPAVMGIVNVTPDSFFSHSRAQSTADILHKVEQHLAEGALFIDIGAYSSRPNAAEVSTSEEIFRLVPALIHIKKEFPQCYFSVDTFNPEVAQEALQNGADIINDIYGGGAKEEMFTVVAQHQVPYIVMHSKGTPNTMQQLCEYEDLCTDIFRFFQQKIIRLHQLGVKDIIVDPGFGFAKNLEQNYALMNHLEIFNALNQPVLVGISRKSMIYKLLQESPETSLNGTTALNTIALLKGANILRVHDVKPAMECIKIVEAMDLS